MSRNGSGTYTLPNAPVVTGTTISSTWANSTLNDIATAITQSIASTGVTTPTANLPMGGFKHTGLGAGSASGDSVRFEQLSEAVTKTGDITMSGASLIEAKGASVASSATTDIWSATDGNTVHITGSTTITSFGTAPQAGAWMKVIFDGALTLTQSANLNLNSGGSNITTAADDMAFVYADTTTQLDVFVIKKSGEAVVSSSSPIAVLTPTAASSVNFLSTFSSLYDNYLIIGEGVLPASDDTLRIRFGVAGVSDTGNNYYGGGVAEETSDTTASNGISLSGSGVESTGRGINFVFHVLNANSVSGLKSVAGKSQSQNDVTPSYYFGGINGAYSAANAISGITFFWAGGANFSATGRISIYAYKNS